MPLMRFPDFIRKYNLPRRTAYGWKGSILPVYQIGRVLMINEAEALQALEKYKLRIRS